jgi:CheY-like chemotaxis protein
LSSFSEIPEVSASPLLHTQRERIRVLVAEPDIASRRLISSLLACESEITANYIDGSRLVSSVRESFPDLVILDANTPAIRQAGGWSGLGIQAPVVTIVTAYDYAALTPFAAFATDLLVKPFDVERFETALDLATSTILRARQNLTTISGTNPLKTTTSGLQFLQRLSVEIAEKVVPVRDVWHFRYLQRRTGKKRPRQWGSGQGTLRSHRRAARYRSPDSDGRHRRGKTLGSDP